MVLLALVGLVAVLVPARNRAQASAERLGCGVNLRQIGTALAAYAAANGGAYPDTLESLVGAGLIASTSFVCPASGDTPARGATPQLVAANAALPAHQSYVYLGRGLKARRGATTGQPLVYEPLGHHGGPGGGANVLYDNGTVAFVPAAQAAQSLGFQVVTPPPATQPAPAAR